MEIEDFGKIKGHEIVGYRVTKTEVRLRFDNGAVLTISASMRYGEFEELYTSIDDGQWKGT